MKNECPEWAANIGVEVRLLTKETRWVTPSITSLLSQIDESENALRRETHGATCADEVDPQPSEQ
jgi:hypothetical protein